MPPDSTLYASIPMPVCSTKELTSNILISFLKKLFPEDTVQRINKYASKKIIPSTYTILTRNWCPK